MQLQKMEFRWLPFTFTLLALLSTSVSTDVSYDSRALKINGERKIILSGSIHYPRSTAEMWNDLIRKAKDGGLNTIETYVFWNAHEPTYRQYDFSGNLDIVRFIKTVQQAGLYSILRIGPYVCAEWNYGGFPVWLHNIPGIKTRTNNDVFKSEMQNFTTVIVNMMKKENLFASQGGPIILAQIENEYGNVMDAYGDDGKTYIQWCARTADGFQIGIPWIMCQQKNAPAPMLETCNGWYCDNYSPTNSGTPKMWTENWTGWFKGWGLANPHRTAEDVAFAVARFFQTGGVLQNYYMYHGGTNFGRTTGGPYITTSYDYDAPLDEYGNLNQPKWGHLRELHRILISLEKTLTYGVKRDIDYGNNASATIYTNEANQSCFLLNANNVNDATVDLFGKSFTIPAWSISILPDCQNEVYNTAKVNTQTSIMVKNSNEANNGQDSIQLNWVWRPEYPEQLKDGKVIGSSLTTKQLLEQKAVTNDTSDYLWYLTSVNVSQSDKIWGTNVTLQVQTMGHIVHAFVNGKLVGNQFAQNGNYKFTMEEEIVLNTGINTISLLSATVGLQNYGGHFDETNVGILGPVKLIGNKGTNQEIVLDLSTNDWTYKVGLRGEDRRLYEESSPHASQWRSIDIPSNQSFIWYKTSFKAPMGTDPIVVDMLGLGKGAAWVNGHSIGRYWLSYNAKEDGCSVTCDYRGAYSDSKCMSACGKPSQRWYHIPRSFLQDNNNALVLFEEFGGTPFNLNFNTITVGTICANAIDGHTLELSCQGERVISNIKFASFGAPTGNCGSFQKGECEAPNTLQVINAQCLSKALCTLNVSETTFGPTGCKGLSEYRLAVEATCSTQEGSQPLKSSLDKKGNEEL